MTAEQRYWWRIALELKMRKSSCMPQACLAFGLGRHDFWGLRWSCPQHTRDYAVVLLSVGKSGAALRDANPRPGLGTTGWSTCGRAAWKWALRGHCGWNAACLGGFGDPTGLLNRWCQEPDGRRRRNGYDRRSGPSCASWPLAMFCAQRRLPGGERQVALLDEILGRLALKPRHDD